MLIVLVTEAWSAAEFAYRADIILAEYEIYFHDNITLFARL